MDAWHDFFVAEAGASAALLGLLFVSVSINLTRILSMPRLPNRGLVALIVLLVILLQSSLLLAPHETDSEAGLLVLLLAVIAWGIVTWLDLQIYRMTEAQYRRGTLLALGLTQLAIVPYIISGIALLTVGVSGLNWILVGVFFCFIKAITDAWVLLVEINR